MEITYEIKNGKKVKNNTYDDGSIDKFDENGNCIHFKDSKGREHWWEYDSNGKMIHTWDSDGFEWFAEGHKECRKKKSNHWWEFWK